jgi:hypothetical protein
VRPKHIDGAPADIYRTQASLIFWRLNAKTAPRLFYHSVDLYVFRVEGALERAGMKIPPMLGTRITFATGTDQRRGRTRAEPVSPLYARTEKQRQIDQAWADHELGWLKKAMA